jgi:hypothetical protein
MTGLEIFDRIAYGQTLFHRDHDAWDLIDVDGLVTAVVFPRAQHVSISPVEKRMPPKPAGRRIPYGEKVVWKITEDQIESGTGILQQLSASQTDSENVKQ